MPAPDASRAELSGDARSYTFVAAAIAGRAVEVVEGERGVAPWTDGRTITVEPAAGAATTLDAVVVQAALIGAGSLSPPVMRRLARRKNVARRYLAYEAARALDQATPLLSASLHRLRQVAATASTVCPEDSLRAARADRATVSLSRDLGVLRPRKVLAVQHAPANETLESDSEGSAAGRDSALARALKRILTGDSAGSERSGTSGADLVGLRAATGGAGTNASALIGVGAPERAINTRLVTISARYPEWDGRSKSYRAEWCTVREVPIARRGSGNDRLAEHLGLQPPLARMGRGLELRRRQRHGDDIDIDAAVERTVALTAGQHPDEAVHLATVRHRRDLSVLVLLDISGSSNELGAGQVPIHLHQLRVAGALIAVLHGLGDRVALHAFRSNGRHDVQVAVVKDFAEPVDQRTLARLAALKPAAYSRLGAAVRHGGRILEHNGGTTRRLLVVLSDGLAFDHGYDRSRGAADVRQALSETRSRGIGCLCLSVGALGGVEDLRHVFGSSAHAAITTPEQLSPIVGPLFETALRSAETRRRPHPADRREDLR